MLLLLLRMCLRHLSVVEHVVEGHGAAAHDVVRHRAVRTRAGLRRVGKGQAGRVNDSVVADQRHGHLRRLSNPLPAASELRDVGHDAEHALLAPVHGLALDVAEPDAKVGSEALAGQLKHRSFAATIQLQ